MRVIITGVAKGGFGGALCEKLAAKAKATGMPVNIVACATGQRPLLQQVVDELSDVGVYIKTVTGDLSDPSVPARMMEESLDWLGGLDAVVSNAGIFYPRTSWQEVTLDHFDRFMTINTRAAWLLAKEAHFWLKRTKGTFIVTSSMCGTAVYPNFGIYCVSKASLIGLSQWLAQAWAADGIRVNALAPGAVVTPLNAERFATEDGKIAYEQLTSQIPLGRFGTPEEVANTMAYLLSPEAAHVTGQTFLIDGGWMQTSARAPRP